MGSGLLILHSPAAASPSLHPHRCCKRNARYPPCCNSQVPKGSLPGTPISINGCKQNTSYEEQTSTKGFSLCLPPRSQSCWLQQCTMGYSSASWHRIPLKPIGQAPTLPHGTLLRACFVLSMVFSTLLIILLPNRTIYLCPS